MNKTEEMLEYLFRWIRLGQAGIKIERLIYDRGFRGIAIYGYNKIAECLVYELEDSLIELKGIIDRKGSEICTDFPAYTLQEATSLDIDAIIICLVDDDQNIRSDIGKILDIPLISFEELIYEL